MTITAHCYDVTIKTETDELLLQTRKQISRRGFDCLLRAVKSDIVRGDLSFRITGGLHVGKVGFSPREIKLHGLLVDDSELTSAQRTLSISTLDSGWEYEGVPVVGRRIHCACQTEPKYWFCASIMVSTLVMTESGSRIFKLTIV